MPEPSDDDHEHGAHGRAPTRGERWEDFKKSPFLPATVLVFILAAAAGLFAGSYTYTMANPTPRRIPTAVVGAANATHGGAFLAGMEKALNASLEVHPYDTIAAAVEGVDQQKVFAILDVRQGDRVALEVSGASGASVAQVLAETAPEVGAGLGVPVSVTDINPLQKGDPRGLAIFYISLAAVIIGFVGAIQLSVHARALDPLERIAYTVAYALLGAFVIAAVVDWWLGALDLPFAESWAILALTMFTSGMVFSMFNTLFGRWAMIPTWGLMVLLGNPSSGGAVSWPLLPSALGRIGRWLPPGASVNAQHTAVYFGGYQHVFPFVVLTAWALLASTIFWVWRHRHPGGRTTEPAHAVAPGP
ncbi:MULTISPECIES: ABC transporter permease [unclassified Streptomyces]|uniref:ABC transporter permease n=1 Tax=unclassified Streptomyces TaxID=2593676 RepID=UPI002E30D4BF|nr:ABC transporter permease [Streptomyces sp. NBC_01280]WSE15905.1 ABC transporter permease [Streptomyces sp. NBC_01397]